MERGTAITVLQLNAPSE